MNSSARRATGLNLPSKTHGHRAPRWHSWSDGVAILVFAGLVYFNRRRLTVICSFSNRAFLSLSNPVKIFLFILVTDMFVGFHSAKGWDAILEGLTVHFGLLDRSNAIKLCPNYRAHWLRRCNFR